MCAMNELFGPHSFCCVINDLRKEGNNRWLQRHISGYSDMRWSFFVHCSIVTRLILSAQSTWQRPRGMCAHMHCRTMIRERTRWDGKWEVCSDLEPIGLCGPKRVNNSVVAVRTRLVSEETEYSFCFFLSFYSPKSISGTWFVSVRIL